MTVVDPPPSEPTDILAALTAEIDELSPQVRRAAVYLLDNPGEIAVTSMRGIADAAGVKPNTLVRLARAIGFASRFREHLCFVFRTWKTRPGWSASCSTTCLSP